MAEFIFIAPEGWTTFTTAQTELMSQPITLVQNWLDVGNFADVTTLMHEAGILPLNEYLIEARVFNGEILVARIGTD